MSTLLCVPIMVQDIESALADAIQAREHGADLVEYRVDAFFSGSGEEYELAQLVELVERSPAPCIITCRPTFEGGEYDGDDDQRISMYERLGTALHPPRYIDVELKTYQRSANIRQKVNLAVDHPAQIRDLATGLILSTHDFQSRPADLTRRILEMRTFEAARIHKIAFMARSIRDNLEVFDLLVQRDRPMIALAMGEHGLLSRVLAPKFGGFLTFAALRDSTGTAPGQPTLDELLNRYRFRSINRSTRVYGIVGFPVSHSKSPIVHNAGFEAIAHDGVYLPMPVAPSPEAFKATVLEMLHHEQLDLAGLSITIPHKQHLVELARDQIASGDTRWTLDPVSEACDAANTLAVDRDESGAIEQLRVFNTDAAAAAGSLSDALDGLAHRHIGIVGAGGVARAIAAAVCEHGAVVTIFNRTTERAASLASALSKRFGARVEARSLDALGSVVTDALVNATPIGMTGGPAPDQSPVDVAVLKRAAGHCVIFDTVYTPKETVLIQHARDAGATVITGDNMFVRQAERQFVAWTGVHPPEGLFANALESAE